MCLARTVRHQMYAAMAMAKASSHLDIVYYLYLDISWGVQENTSIRSQEFPWAAPSGIPSTSCCYFTLHPSSCQGTDTVHHSNLGKNKLHELCGVQLFFSAKIVNIFAKFEFLIMQIRNNFKTVIFIPCK